MKTALHDLPESERPRERLLNLGPTALSTQELLAIVLRTGSVDMNVIEMASYILANTDGLVGLARLNAAQLMHIKGLGAAKAAQILAALELGRRATIQQPAARAQIRTSADAALLLSDMGTLTQEQIRVLLLDSRQRVEAIRTIYIGTVDTSVLRIAELFREAIMQNAPAMILAHNHPSGDPTPSPEDINLTRDLLQASALLDIQLVDHLIIGANAWRSLRESGLLSDW